MWLKCPVCGNVYASGYDEKNEWRDVGSVCKPPTLIERVYGRPSGSCAGRLVAYNPPQPAKVYCRRCCNTYSTAYVTCPTCYRLAQYMPE